MIDFFSQPSHKLMGQPALAHEDFAGESSSVKATTLEKFSVFFRVFSLLKIGLWAPAHPKKILFKTGTFQVPDWSYWEIIPELNIKFLKS